MIFCKGMKQPLADLQPLQLEKKETASEPFLWHTPEGLKHVRGRSTTGADDKTHKISYLFSFVKRCQRTEGPYGAGKNKGKHNIMVAPESKDELNRAGLGKIGKQDRKELECHKQDKKELECDPV